MLEVVAAAFVASVCSFGWHVQARPPRPRGSIPRLTHGLRGMRATWVHSFQTPRSSTEKCSPAQVRTGRDPGSSAPCEGLSSDPGDWAMRTGLDSRRSRNGLEDPAVDAIPLAQAQRWWSTALHDLTVGCSAIGIAQKAWLARSSVGGNTTAVSEPGDSAAADMQTASLLLRTVDKTIS